MWSRALHGVEWSARHTWARYNKSLDASGVSELVIDNLSVTWLTAAASTQPLCGSPINLNDVTYYRNLISNDYNARTNWRVARLLCCRFHGHSSLARSARADCGRGWDGCHVSPPRASLRTRKTN